MLHMIVNTHNPESCAFRGKEEEEILSRALDQFRESAPEKGLTLQGSWVNRSGHEIFILVDAPNGHVIEDVLLSAGLVGRTHTRIVPVLSVQEVFEAESGSR